MIVTIDALFSSSNKIGGKIIAYGTAHLAPNVKEKVSHTALLVNKRWVHESTGKTGVQVVSYDKWCKTHKEVDRVSLGLKEYQDIADVFRHIKGKKYDYMGILYFVFAIIPTFFGVELPDINEWQSFDKYFCSEVLGEFTGYYYGMSAPIQILDQLRNDT